MTLEECWYALTITMSASRVVYTTNSAESCNVLAIAVATLHAVNAWHILQGCLLPDLCSCSDDLLCVLQICIAASAKTYCVAHVTPCSRPDCNREHALDSSGAHAQQCCTNSTQRQTPAL